MEYRGNLIKMAVDYPDPDKGREVEYTLRLGEDYIEMNRLVGAGVRICFVGEINCIHCGRITSKSFAQGYCYPCFIKLPETDSCVLRPETCQAHLGISRDMEWSVNNCLTEHIVYLAVSPGLKVGVTRLTQVPARWIDQGAWEAIELARTADRYTAGIIEVFLKGYLSDKTNWRDMLTGVSPSIEDLFKEKERIAAILPEQFKELVSDNNNITRIRYPVLSYPKKVKSMNFDTDPLVEGVLTGIKGQYLIFESGSVLNIRKFGGYMVTLET